MNKFSTVAAVLGVVTAFGLGLSIGHASPAVKEVVALSYRNAYMTELKLAWRCEVEDDEVEVPEENYTFRPNLFSGITVTANVKQYTCAWKKP